MYKIIWKLDKEVSVGIYAAILNRSTKQTHSTFLVLKITDPLH